MERQANFAYTELLPSATPPSPAHPGSMTLETPRAGASVAACHHQSVSRFAVNWGVRPAEVGYPWLGAGGDKPEREPEKKGVDFSTRIHRSRSWAVEKHFIHYQEPHKCEGLLVHNYYYFPFKIQLFNVYIASSRAKEVKGIWVCTIWVADTCDLRQVPPTFIARLGPLRWPKRARSWWTESGNMKYNSNQGCCPFLSGKDTGYFFYMKM